MALAAVKITLGGSLGGGVFGTTIKGSSVPDFTTVTANVATLVADGASPTQGHVTTLNTNYTALAAAVSGADVVVTWDASVVTSRSALRAALHKALEAVNGGYGALAE